MSTPPPLHSSAKRRVCAAEEHSVEAGLVPALEERVGKHAARDRVHRGDAIAPAAGPPARASAATKRGSRRGASIRARVREHAVEALGADDERCVRARHARTTRSKRTGSSDGRRSASSNCLRRRRAEPARGPETPAPRERARARAARGSARDGEPAEIAQAGAVAAAPERRSASSSDGRRGARRPRGRRAGSRRRHARRAARGRGSSPGRAHLGDGARAPRSGRRGRARLRRRRRRGSRRRGDRGRGSATSLSSAATSAAEADGDRDGLLAALRAAARTAAASTSDESCPPENATQHGPAPHRLVTASSSASSGGPATSAGSGTSGSSPSGMPAADLQRGHARRRRDCSGRPLPRHQAPARSAVSHNEEGPGTRPGPSHASRRYSVQEYPPPFRSSCRPRKSASSPSLPAVSSASVP